MADVRRVDPLEHTAKIVNPQTGLPTPYFMRVWNASFNVTNDTGGLLGVNLIAGTGLTGGGLLGDFADITFAIDPEYVQDLAGAMWQDSSTLDFTYNDGAGTLTGVLKDTAVTPGTYGDDTHVAQITVDQQGRITAVTDVAITGGGGGSAAWTLAGSWDFAVSGTTASPIDFTGLSGANEILVIARGITKSVSGTLDMRLSVDNGSTFFSTLGNYAAQGSDGQDTNATIIPIHTSSSAAARGGNAQIVNAGIGVPVIHTSGQIQPSVFLGSTSAINAVRLLLSGGGNFTGGSIHVYTR